GKAATVRRMNLCQQVRGQCRDAQLDSGRVPLNLTGHGPQLPVLGGEARTAQVDGTQILTAIEGDGLMVGHVLEVGEKLHLHNGRRYRLVLPAPDSSGVGSEAGLLKRVLQS